MLFDRQIEVYLLKNKPLNGAVNLTGPSVFTLVGNIDKGPKPKVSLSSVLLPSSAAKEVTLKITNLSVSVDTRAYAYIYIVAGYKHSTNKAIFQGEIFNSYIEKPNPEGVTVFQVILADLDKAVLPITVDIDKEEMSIEAYVNTIMNEVDLALKLDIPKTLASITLTDVKGVLTFSNIEETLLHIKEVLDKNLTKVETLQVSYDFETVIIRVVDSNNYLLLYDDIEINNIKSAYFQGGNVIISMLWDPRLVPGTIFKCSLKFFKGRLGTKVLALSLSDDTAYFEVISNTISFETNGTNNSDVMAIVRS